MCLPIIAYIMKIQYFRKHKKFNKSVCVHRYTGVHSRARIQLYELVPRVVLLFLVQL